MFSWITGPKITNEIEDLRPESNYESTFIDAPDTPAHEFPVKAFKHALFGTPAPEDAAKKAERKAKINAANAKPVELPAPAEDTPPITSPSKQPGGVLRTPGTIGKGRKTVSFGSQVVDNEGKRGNIGKSGIPNDCPGKFPSPWTPGTQLQLDIGSDKRPRTKLTEALLDARTTTQPKSGQKPKARDDSDITIDLGAPRSESGKYWKDQYESYAERSEKEMKKVIAKQQLAKKFAMKKDGEVTELANKLEQERRKFRQRERELEQQNQDLQERLRKAIEENASTTMEVASLRARLTTLQQSNTATMLESQQSKPTFDIYEDLSKDANGTVDPSFSLASSGKENKSPRSRRQYRQSMPEVPARLNSLPRLGAGQGEVSIILGRSPRHSANPPAPSTEPRQTLIDENHVASPQKSRNMETRAENKRQLAPVEVPPSSPLPVPSPGLDPWMDLNNDSSIHQMDKMAMPVSSGQPYTRPSWNPPPKQHRNSKPVSQTKSTNPPRATEQRTKPARVEEHKDVSSIKLQDRETRPQSKSSADKQQDNLRNLSRRTDESSGQQRGSALSPTDPKFDLSKITAHHAEGSAKVKEDRPEIVDRKEQARKRLEERRKLKKSPPL